jgi:hypothetical protein
MRNYAKVVVEVKKHSWDKRHFIAGSTEKLKGLCELMWLFCVVHSR